MTLRAAILVSAVMLPSTLAFSQDKPTVEVVDPNKTIAEVLRGRKQCTITEIDGVITVVCPFVLPPQLLNSIRQLRVQ